MEVPLFVDSRAYLDQETLDAIISDMNEIRAKYHCPLIAAAWIRAMNDITDAQVEREFREFITTFASKFATIVLRDLAERTEAVRKADEEDHGMTLRG